MPEPRTVSLFRNGRNQAVRIPVEFELPGDEALMRKEGDSIIIEPSLILVTANVGEFSRVPGLMVENWLD
jgi:antitoxin VapB